MLLSIIIPHYNLPKQLLERCLQSIITLEMPMEDYEIIVVDDGSKNPPLWIENGSYAENIRLIQAKHGGPGAARNRGIEEAKGKYIEFVDGDDMMAAGGNFSECLEILRRENPDILRFKYTTCIQTETEPVKQNKKVSFSNTISGAFYMWKFNLSGSPCTYFFRRELAVKKDIRFPENIFHEDEEFNTIIHYHAKTLIYSDAILYCYCIREGSTTANNSPAFETKRIDDMLTVIENLSKFKKLNVKKENVTHAKGFEHKFTMLAVDIILNMMYAGMSAKAIHSKCKERLAPIGVYPLPKASYSLKYILFRILANNSFGMKILRLITPKEKPQKR